jgi:hypothetical protein
MQAFDAAASSSPVILRRTSRPTSPTLSRILYAPDHDVGIASEVYPNLREGNSVS